MKAQKDLKSAIINNLTLEQQIELAGMITELTQAAKHYAIGLANPDVSVNEVSNRLTRANNAWSDLRHIGLNVSF